MQPNYVALDYDKNLERVNLDHTYGPGRHALGVNHQLVPFPTKNVQLLFCDDVCVDQESDSGPITSRSRDGLAVEIRLSLQYKVDTSRESMASLFYDYGLPEVNPNLAVQVARPTYKVLYIAVARSELRHVIAKYVKEDAAAAATIPVLLLLLLGTLLLRPPRLPPSCYYCSYSATATATTTTPTHLAPL